VARPRAGAGATLDVIVPPPPASAVAFVDARHGWAGGAGGLLGTTDGRTFRIEVRAPIIGISAFDRSRAWALTGDGFVLRTPDGRHWSRLGAPHLFRLQFVDARVGFGMTREGVLVRSGDAGRTWAQARAPRLVQSECFTTRSDGWIARGGTVWRTHDGGAQWIRTRLRAGSQEVPDLGCRRGDAWVLFHGGAAAGTEGYRVFRSLGSGPWRAVLASPFQRKLPAISNYAGPFTVVGHGTAVFTGSCAPCAGLAAATVVRTVDGGSSFTRTALGGPAPSAISFLDARRGWLVAGRQLEQTNGGGLHWRAVARLP
jgi:photosystem II stability/assembly factor-like uncharacterized protein